MSITIQSGVASTAAAGASLTLLGTLTTTSGTTQSLTGIAAGYRQLYCEVEDVSFTATTTALTVALSSTNGAAYGSAATVSAALSNSGHKIGGFIIIGNISSAIADGKSASVALNVNGNAPTIFAVYTPTNTAAVVDAIRFAGGTFDGGTIRIYGVK